MKGPAARWKHDVRRVWMCPACGRRERTGGHIVHVSCDCQMKGDLPRQTWMRLMEREPPLPPPPPAEPQLELPSNPEEVTPDP